MFLSRVLSDFGIFIAFIAIITGISIGLTYVFPERKFMIRKWLHIFSVGITALVIYGLSVFIPDSFSENRVFLGLQLFDDFLLLILIINVILWIAVFGGFFKINGRKSWGIAWFPLSLFIILYGIRYFAPEKNMGAGLYFSAVVFFILAFADGFAALVGYNINPSNKTRTGSMVFFGITFLIISVSIKYAPIHSLPATFLDEKCIFLFSLFGALILSTLEYYSKNGIDNLTVPIGGMFYLVSFSVLPFWEKLQHVNSFFFLAMIFLVLGLLYAVFKMKWLSESGIVLAVILAFVMLVSEMPFLPILAFFILGTLAGKIPQKNNNKSVKNPSNELDNSIVTDGKHGKPRDAMQVLANGGIPLLLGLTLVFSNSQFFSELNFINQYTESISDEKGTWLLLYWSVMSAALSDTWSSELGMKFGKNSIDIIGFRKLQAGASGGITWMGTLFGFLGSLIIGILFLVSRDGSSLNLQVSNQDWKWFLIITISGFLGTILDSILGSIFQRKKQNIEGLYTDDENSGFTWRYWSNDLVNLVSLLLVTLGIVCLI
jgi:uncharacterized protein (TIGR00297 family)